MFEGAVVTLLSQNEDRLGTVVIGLFFLGGIVAVAVNSSQAELGRGPYWAYSALVALFLSLSQIVWLHVQHATIGGYLWLLVFMAFGAIAIGGFLIGQIAMARSRDAYGHAGFAILAFVPFGNLWLFFARSRAENSPNRLVPSKVFSGGWAFVSGLAIFIASFAVTGFLVEEMDRIEAELENEPASHKHVLAHMIHSRGIEETLQFMASNATTPIFVDDTTEIRRIEAQGARLIRNYSVDSDVAELPLEFVLKHTKDLCADDSFSFLMRSGASISEVYLREDGHLIGEIVVNDEKCVLYR